MAKLIKFCQSANLFSIVSSLALKAIPYKANEIPSLLIVGDIE